MRSFASGTPSVALTMLLACGGNVAVAPPSTGGSGGATTSTSSEITTSTSADPCPAPFPGIEATCSDEGLVCGIPYACCSGMAMCKGGLWRFIGPFCDQPCTPECGPNTFTCAAGALCLAYLGATTIYQCVPSPCGMTIECACAEALCEAEGMVCNNIQEQYKVLCD